MPNWTTEQQQAIDLDGTNIIVSAGAGSGKTAVLTQRVLRKLKQGVDIDHLLILTFTNAAAAEMKDRIRKAITKEESLKDQLDKIDKAYITTFDSYAFSVVKKYHYLLNNSKNIKIGDATLFELKKKELIEEILNERYEQEDELFHNMISSFCTKDDDNIRKSILDISNKLDLKYDKKEYLNNYLDKYYTKEYIDSLVGEYVSLLKRKQNEIEVLLKELSLMTDGDFTGAMEDVLSPLLNAKTYREIVSSLDIKLPILRGVEEAKPTKEAISILVKDLKTLCIYDTEEEMKDNIRMTKETTRVLIKIILELDKRLEKYKTDEEQYEFIDISKMAIRVLKENKEVKKELKLYFNEIMVDEYQDTNDLQEMFINLIENNNIYMVGDIKQSIYRFRNANPNIFKEKYDCYSRGEGGRKIDLNKNFRSREEVLTNINTVFDLVMDDMIGGASYQNSHRMIFGNLTYQNEGKLDQVSDFEILSYPLSKDSLYKKEEIEIFIIASDIKNKVENHYKVFDKDSLIIRDITYSDIAILLDRSSQFDLYKRIFTFLKIPLAIEKDESMTGETELSLLKNIIRLIVKVKKKEYDTSFRFSYIALARSYLYRYSDETIFNVLHTKKYEEMVFMNIINELAYHLEEETVSSLIRKIINKFPFYQKIITVGNVEAALNRFEYLENLALTLEECGYTVYDFQEYLEKLEKEELDIKYTPYNESGNSCKIMTIHKSKGLEFPICYYAGLYAKFNISDLKTKFMYDNRYGFIVPYFKEGIGETILKVLAKEQYLADEISEKIRLFYVAMTRAKEKMILITSLEDEDIIKKDERGVIDTSVRLKYNSFQSILKSIKDELLRQIKTIDLKDIPVAKDYNITRVFSLDKVLAKKEDVLVENEQEFEIEIEEEQRFSKTIKSLISKEETASIELGLKFHHILEMMDLKNPDFSQLDSFYKGKVEKLCSLPEIKSANEIYQEYEFVDRDNNTHGIIDLLLVYDDKIIIIDYKLKNIKEEAYLNQLQGYQNFIERKTKKKTSCYLYSILTSELINIIQ